MPKVLIEQLTTSVFGQRQLETEGIELKICMSLIFIGPKTYLNKSLPLAIYTDFFRQIFQPLPILTMLKHFSLSGKRMLAPIPVGIPASKYCTRSLPNT